MNVKRKEAALRKIEQWKLDGKVETSDDARQLLEQDETNGTYPPDEIDEIIAAMETTEELPRNYPSFVPQDPAKADISAANNAKSANPNDLIAADLAKFDYNNLAGKNLTGYLKFHETLNWNTDYNYDYYRIDVIKEPRYEGVKESPVDITGIRIKENAPINSTRISAKTAATLNGVNLKTTRQGVVLEGAQFENTKKIYLLKK